MKTSIIILTRNKIKYLKLCIASIKKYTKNINYEIVVIDNNSTDGTVEWLHKQKELIKIYNDRNLGFSGGNNQGIKAAKGDNIMFLNNDVIVTTKWLENLITCLYSSRKIGAVGPLTNYCSNAQSIQLPYNSINEMELTARKFNVSNKGKWEERNRLIGFCLLVKKEVVSKVGLFDERFFPGNFEDDDYSIRMRKLGYKLMLCKDTFIYHYGSKSFYNTNYLKLLDINKKKFEEKWNVRYEDILK